MRYLSVCSGIEAATVAWHPLGWTPAAFAEIEAFPRAVLKHHYPSVPLHGDFTTIEDGQYGSIDLLVGGTPCQDFSVTGLRAGIAGERGNLTLEFLRLASRTRPRWVVWENVPGVLSSDGGRALGAFLGGLAELGYGFAYRILDAQHFGLAQRRARVFVVGYLGDWRRAAAVLFERESLQGHPAPCRETRERIAAFTPSSIGGYREGIGSLRANGGDLGGGSEGLVTRWPADVAPTLNAHFGDKQGLEDQHALNGAGLFTLAHSLRASGGSEDGTGRGTPLVVAHAFDARQSDVIQYGDKTGPLDTDGYTMGVLSFDWQKGSDRNNPRPSTMNVVKEGTNTLGSSRVPAIAFSAKDHGADASDISPTLRSGSHHKSHANGEVMPAVAFSIMPMNSGKDYKARAVDVAQPIMAGGPVGGNQGGDVIVQPAVAFAQNQRDEVRLMDVAGALASEPGMKQQTYVQTSAVRRLTPTECERLQGFPDGYTLVPCRGKPASDGPRYKALGNSMAVPVMGWIGRRIAMVEAMAEARAA